MLWDAERKGASTAAEQLGWRVSWKPPTTESDVAGQSALIAAVAASDYRGLIVAPNHVHAQIEPLRRVQLADVPIVVLAGKLDLPAAPGFAYIVNDDEKMGELAAEEMARRIGGAGAVALIGLARSLPGVNTRARSAESYLAKRFPEITVVDRDGGAFSSNRAEEIAAEILKQHRELKGLLTFTARATRGAHDALRANTSHPEVVLIGNEQDADLLEFVREGQIAGLVAADTYEMGYKAVEAIANHWSGKSFSRLTVVPPVLITPESYATEGAVSLMLPSHIR